ncbi:MAG: hypothetical protein AB7F86_09040 [Bdellovibrionales bacterium]
MRQLILGFLLLVTGFQAGGEVFPLKGVELNRAFELNLKRDARFFSSASGFEATYVKNGAEVSLKGIQLADANLANQKMKVDFVNMETLYKPRTNPYQGQISDLVRCGPDLKPLTSKIHVLGEEVPVLFGGVNSRKLFGACARDQVGFWGAYFQFYHEAQKMTVEVRIFADAGKSTLAQARSELLTLARQLFVEQVPGITP